MQGRSVVVVGASAGIGRAFARKAAERGARVLAMARRKDRLLELQSEAPNDGAGLFTVAADISTEEGRHQLAAAAESDLGPVDLVLYAAGNGELGMFAELNADEWLPALETNVIGVQQAFKVLLPMMSEGGILAALSSEAVQQPRSGLGVYAASKAALQKSLEIWRIEQPGLRFCCVPIGTTVPTEFGSSYDVEKITALMTDWTARGLTQADFMSTDDLVTFLADTFNSALGFPGISIDEIVLRSPSAVVTSMDGLFQEMERKQAAD